MEIDYTRLIGVLLTTQNWAKIGSACSAGECRNVNMKMPLLRLFALSIRVCDGSFAFAFIAQDIFFFEYVTVLYNFKCVRIVWLFPSIKKQKQSHRINTLTIQSIHTSHIFIVLSMCGGGVIEFYSSRQQRIDYSEDNVLTFTIASYRICLFYHSQLIQIL